MVTELFEVKNLPSPFCVFRLLLFLVSKAVDAYSGLPFLRVCASRLCWLRLPPRLFLLPAEGTLLLSPCRLVTDLVIVSGFLLTTFFLLRLIKSFLGSLATVDYCVCY